MTVPDLAVRAPVRGRVLPLREVPDPVFAAAMVGPGLAIDPPREASEAVAPIDGTVVQVVVGPEADTLASDIEDLM